jgi:hypothetical protein
MQLLLLLLPTCRMRKPKSGVKSSWPLKHMYNNQERLYTYAIAAAAGSHLQDEEAKERGEVQLAKKRWQDAAVDLQVRLGDLGEEAAAAAVAAAV